MLNYPLKIIAWLGSRGGLFLFAVLLVVAGTWGFIALTDEVTEGGTQHFDLRVNKFCYYHRGPSWLHEAERDITSLGGITVLTLMVASVVGFLILNRQRGMMVFVIVATLGGLLLSSGLKRSFDRPRPPLKPAGTIVYTTSFPSGHSMLSAATYLTLGSLLARATSRRLLKFYFITLALLLTLLIGVSRVYLCAHYPTDVLAGWTAGLVWAIACWTAARELQRRGAVEKPGEEARIEEMDD